MRILNESFLGFDNTPFGHSGNGDKIEKKPVQARNGRQVNAVQSQMKPTIMNIRDEIPTLHPCLAG